MTPLAKSIGARGWAALNVEYRRVGPYGGGGGWPETFEDVLRSVDHLARLADGGVPLDLDRVVICGHSAGAHLGFLVAADAADRRRRVRLAGAMALAGVLDLRAADELGLGADAAANLMGCHAEEAAAAYDAASPIEMLPLGVPQVLVHGTRDRAVPVAMSEQYAERARAAGDDVRLIVLEETGHRDVVDAGGQAWAVALAELGGLLGV